MNSAEWEYKRERVKERARYKCERCGGQEGPLQVHHLHYNGEADNPSTPWPPGWDCKICYLRLLCKPCHLYAHGKGPDPLQTPTWAEIEEMIKKLNEM